MKSNENEITTHLNGSFAVPYMTTIKAIVISNQDCFDGEWNALIPDTPWPITNVIKSFICISYQNALQTEKMSLVISLYLSLNARLKNFSIFKISEKLLTQHKS